MRLGTVVIREFADVPSVNGVAVGLLDVTFDSGVPGALSARVRGVGTGTAVVVTVAWPGGSVSSTVEPSGGLFETSVALVPLELLGGWVRIDALATGPSDAAAPETASDAAVVSVEQLTPAGLAGIPATIDARRLALLAGSTDRLVRRRHFTPLSPTRWLVPVTSVPLVLEDIGRIDVDGVVVGQAITDALEAVEARIEAGEIATDDDHAAALDTAINSGIDAAMRTAADNAGGRTPDTGPGEEKGTAQPLAVRGMDVWTPPRKGARSEEAREALRRFVTSDQFVRLGMLFDERLRFQPAGLVLGEEVASISLAPGEQVEVRQTVETKRRTLLEEILDREQERETTLSSTWSTEVTEGFTSNDESTTTMSLDTRAGAEVPLPDIPVTVDAAVARNLTVANAHDNSTESSTQAATERTRTAANRLRSQHRVRVEITSEQSTGLASTRTLRNPNQERAVTFIMRKLYRRDRVTHERYGARLCLRLTVHNPSRGARTEFIDRLGLLSPESAAARAGIPELPGELRGKVVGEFTAGASLDADTEFETIRHDVRDVDIRASWIGDDDPGDRVLLQVGSPTVTEIDLQIGGQLVFAKPGIDRTETLSGAEAQTQYRDRSGRIVWEMSPAIGQPQPLGILAIDFPRVIAQPYPSNIYNTINQVSRVAWEAETVWGTAGEDARAYQDAVRTALTQAYEEFEESRVVALRDAASRVYPGQVVDAALRGLGSRLDEAYNLLDVSDAFVENAPWWSAAAGTNHVEALRAALKPLPMQAPFEDYLVPALIAPRAEVYLPIRPGAEKEALRLVDNLYDPVRLRNQVEAHRTKHFPVHEQALPTDKEVTGPVAPAATPAGSAEWLSTWEPEPRGFDVLGAWAENFPIDGVHTEMLLSATSAADEGSIARPQRT